jgi:NAD+ synthase
MENKMKYKKIILPKMDVELVAKEIEDFILDEITSFGRTGAVIGLSGGVDSTTTAALTKRAFDKYNANPANSNRKLELVAYLLPSKLNSPEDVFDGKRVAERLGIRYETKSIEEVVNSYRLSFPDLFAGDRIANYHRGNMISEIRATFLHVLAALEFKSLLGTGNKDEDFGVYYYTLFGDGAVHLCPIANLSKRLVKEMACYLGFRDLAYREPTAGLEPGQTDFKDLGCTYELVELVSEGLNQGFKAEELFVHPQVCEMANRDIERYEKLFGEKKFHTAEELVSEIIEKKKKGKFKSRIVAPPMAKITLEYK